MCTVSIVALNGCIRVACNRDESPARPPALAPDIVTRGGVRTLMPVDPLSGGTWLAATENACIFALLNRTPPSDADARSRSAPRSVRSRGEILLRLLGSSTPDAVLDAMKDIDHRAYRPFRIIAVLHDVVLEVVPGVRTRRWRLQSPLMFTSSGLGDRCVQAPRRALFTRLMARRTEWVAGQDRFHTQHSPSRPHLSVLMHRPGARTVSRAVVEMTPSWVRMSYWPNPKPDATAPPVIARMELAAVCGSERRSDQRAQSRT